MSFNRIISAAERAKPQTATIHSIEKLFGYEIRYLAYYGNNQFEWLSDPCDSYVLKYDADQLDEAANDIAAHGGGLVSFPARGVGPDRPSSPTIIPVPAMWSGHNTASRLEHRFEVVRGAQLETVR